MLTECHCSASLNKDRRPLNAPSPSTPLPPTGAPTFRFSSGAFAKRERVAGWYEMLGRRAVRLAVEPLTEEHRVDSVGLALPGLPIVAANVVPARIGRTRQLVGEISGL